MSLASLKILIVDDDHFFREILQKSLEGLGARVFVVESVDMAKRSMPLFEPQVILSDVQMPTETGIDLLKWVKLNHPDLPVVIMTGFSELLDAASAAQAGASGFLAKPFREDDLAKLLKELVTQTANTKAGLPNPLTAVEPRPTLAYMKVSIEDFLGGSQLEVPIYVRVPTGTGDRYIKVAHKGEDLSVDRVRTYRAKGLKHLFLERADYLNYLGMSVNITQAAKGLAVISNEKKVRLVRHTMELVQQQFQEADISEDVFDHASTLVETSVSLLSGDDAGYLLLESLKDISDQLYAHASGVSMVAGMIGHMIGWRSAKTLAKVSMAGMLHDIGKKQLPRELAIKSKTKMSPEEIIQYETHPKRGLEILSDLDYVPAEVIQAVYQHHERGNGTGFPARLLDAKIYPLAKIIAVADEFCKLYLNSADREKGNPARCLNRLFEIYSDGLSPEPLVALYEAFKLVPPEALARRAKRTQV